tara:strand:- start:44607 stop:44801 length:195 start_codon:yes stop_codon:yes gene_type:complete
MQHTSLARRIAMLCVSALYVVALVLPVVCLIACALWLVVKFPSHGSVDEGVSSDELDALSKEDK